MVTLVPSLDGQLQLPTSVTIPANEASFNFAVDASDDVLVDGDIAVAVTAYVTSATGIVLGDGSTTAILEALDNDGPALTLSFSNSLIAEGGTSTATITRNTPTGTTLLVNLSSNPADQATVPSTVLLDVDEASATFAVTGVLDGAPDGLQFVSITASADGQTAPR